jgi:DNA-binding NarL/FixJ family response regulator
VIRVAIADDHAILREGVKLLLEADADIDVIGQASNGLEAVRLAAEEKPDVMLMDIQMPGVDGIEATERVRRQAPTTKVLVLSQIDNEEYLVRVLQAGAMGYVLKQNASEELVAAVHTVHKGHVYMTPYMASRFVQMHFRKEEEKKDRSKQLTPREQEVLKGIAEGLTNQQIADDLNVSIKTVQTHRGNIMEKLNLHDRVELVKYAIRAGLVQLNAEQGSSE